MLQAKFSVKESQAQFLSKYKEYGFKDKSSMLRTAIDHLKRELELEQLKQSADLYSEIYSEDDDLKALIGAAAEFRGQGFLVPARNSELLRWCLDRGLRVVQQMTLMGTGMYKEPAGAYLPSVIY